MKSFRFISTLTAAILPAFCFAFLLAFQSFANDLISDTLAVRAILDSAGFNTVHALAVADTVNGRVDKLTLRAGVSSIAPEIGMLDKMRYLFLENNFLTTLPASLAACTSVIRFYLHYNSLDTVPSCILALPHLFDLRISSNNLTRLPDGFENMRSLDTLFCDDNQLDSIPTSLCRAKRLRGLNFRFNNLTTLPDSISNLDSLAVLTVCCNQITHFPPSLTKLSHVRLFDCGGNKLCDVDTATASWIDAHDGYWRATQKCDTNPVNYPIEIKPVTNGFIKINDNRFMISSSTSGTFTLLLFSVDGKLYRRQSARFASNDAKGFSLPIWRDTSLLMYVLVINNTRITTGKLCPGR